MITRRRLMQKLSVAGAGLWLSTPYNIASPQFGATTEAPLNRSILHNRTRQVSIRLLDAKGKPLPHKKVEIKQLKHAFRFGDCNPGMDSMYRQGSATAEKLKIYRKVFASVFNAVNATCYWTERPRNNMAKTEEFQG